MKLLCVVPSYWPAFQFGGPIFSVHGLNKALVKKGIDVAVYTTNVGLNGKVPVNKEVNVEGVKVTYFTFIKFFEFLGATGWQFSLSMTKALKNNLKEFDIVYIVSVWNFPTAVTSYYCRKYKKPYIISPRGHLYPYTYGKKSWKKIPYYHLVAKKHLRNASAIHYTTEDEAEKCHFTLGMKNRAIVIPNGVDLSEFESLPAKETLQERYPALKDKKVILFLGRINWKKGLDILIEAYTKLVKERDDMHLLIVGNDEGGYGEKVKSWIKDHGLGYEDYGTGQRAESKVQRVQDNENVIDAMSSINAINSKNAIRVTFTGMLTGKEKLEAYAGSDIFVLPSYSENFGMTVLEAMACGLPVIISNQVGIHKEVSEAKAGVVIQFEDYGVAEAMAELLDNSIACKEIGENGKRLVEQRFTWDKVAGHMVTLYENILARA